MKLGMKKKIAPKADARPASVGKGLVMDPDRWIQIAVDGDQYGNESGRFWRVDLVRLLPGRVWLDWLGAAHYPESH